jgi:hypothetical protein
MARKKTPAAQAAAEKAEDDEWSDGVGVLDDKLDEVYAVADASGNP